MHYPGPHYGCDTPHPHTHPVSQPGPTPDDEEALTGPGLPDLHPGIYRHYKGPLYQALGYGHDANDETRVVVVYMPLQLDRAHEGPRLAVRSVYGDEGCWHDRVHPVDGSKCESECPEAVPRFEWLGYEFAAWMVTDSGQ